ncbi:MAG: hypothetical protein HOH74_16945 [Gemmatimonadetes bacterium]|nr:hypothetical protein [Gemmatimonadota bacterium]
MSAGLLVGRNWGQVLEWLGLYNRLALLVLAVVLVGVGIRWWHRRRRGADE